MSFSVHRLAMALAAFVLLCVIGVRPTQAQLADSLTFRTPFPFIVGNASMPAGQYSIQRLGDDQFVYLVRGPRSVMLQVNPVGRAPEISPDKNEVIFTKYGDQFFLREVWEADASAGVESSMKYKGEREARGEDRPMTSIPAQVAVLASR